MASPQPLGCLTKGDPATEGLSLHILQTVRSTLNCSPDVLYFSLLYYSFPAVLFLLFTCRSFPFFSFVSFHGRTVPFFFLPVLSQTYLYLSLPDRTSAPQHQSSASRGTLIEGRSAMPWPALTADLKAGVDPPLDGLQRAAVCIFQLSSI